MRSLCCLCIPRSLFRPCDTKVGDYFIPELIIRILEQVVQLVTTVV
jgi:hypothetical protein